MSPTNDSANLLFFHVSETGSEALWTLLAAQLPGEAPRRHLTLGHSAELVKFGDEELAAFDCVIGPFGLAHQGRFPPDWFAYTMLRDPVERTIDLFHRWKFEMADSVLGELAAASDIYGFVRSDHPLVVEFVDNAQAWTLAGDIATSARSTSGLSRNDLLRRAARRLTQLDGFGLFEEWTESFARLCSAFGVSWDAVPRPIAEPIRPAPDEASRIDRRRLRRALGDRIQLDEQLHRFARRAFARYASDAGSPWARRAKEMRRRLRAQAARISELEERLGAAYQDLRAERQVLDLTAPGRQPTDAAVGVSVIAPKLATANRCFAISPEAVGADPQPFSLSAAHALDSDRCSPDGSAQPQSPGQVGNTELFPRRTSNAACTRPEREPESVLRALEAVERATAAAERDELKGQIAELQRYAADLEHALSLICARPAHPTAAFHGGERGPESA